MRTRMVIIALLLGITTPLMAADWGVLMIDLGKQDVSRGILLHTNADGITEPQNVGGEDARVIPKTPPGLATGNHAYFIVDPAVVPEKAADAELWIGVEYFDEVDAGVTGFLMDYDDKGDAYPQQAFALNLPQEGRSIQFTNTGEWLTAIIAIDQAEFKEQGNGGDFRFHIVPYMSGEFALNRVWVSNRELTEADLTGVQAVDPSGKLASRWAEIKQQ